MGVVNRYRGPAIGLAALLLAGCGQAGSATSDAESPTPAPASVQVTLTDEGCELNGAAELTAGPMTFAMVNETAGIFDLDVWRLDEGREYDELAAHVTEEMRRFEAGEPPLGHPQFAQLVTETATEPGAGAELPAELEPGTYGLACIAFIGPEELGGIWAAGPIQVAPG